MSPKTDERGQAWLFRDQRRMMVELDKFVTARKFLKLNDLRCNNSYFKLTVRPGQNILKRRSTESTITIPYERTFRNLDARPAGGAGEAAFNFCGCGWPQHVSTVRINFKLKRRFEKKYLFYPQML